MKVNQVINKLPVEGVFGNPFFSRAFWAGLIEYFGSNAKLGILQDQRSVLLYEGSSKFKLRTFLPSQAQISLNTFPAIDASQIKRLFSDNALCLSIDILCADTLYLKPENVNWPAVERKSHATTTAVKIEGTFEDYWASRSKNLRKNIKRYFSRIDDLNEAVTLKVSSEGKELKDAIERYGILESAGWKAAEGTAIHPDNLQGRFYSDFMSSYADGKGACVYELYFGEALVASRLCVFSDQMLIVLKTTFDEAYKAYAVGRILLYRILEKEFDLRRVKQVEFYTNATAEQISWATETREIYHLTFYRNALVQTAYTLLRTIKRRLRKSQQEPESHEQKEGAQ